MDRAKKQTEKRLSLRFINDRNNAMDCNTYEPGNMYKLYVLEIVLNKATISLITVNRFMFTTVSNKTSTAITIVVQSNSFITLWVQYIFRNIFF